jgi:MarR family transcriptional regulator, lower aerobic nicotinate degradation pathway regulator
LNLQLLHNLLDEAEKYAQQNLESTDVRSFANWILRKEHLSQVEDAIINQSLKPIESTKEDVSVTPIFQEEIETTLAKYIVYLNRYAKIYSKKALEGSPLGSTDEFVYLVALLFQGSKTKIELIHIGRHEKPTGMEIIRRLQLLGFIDQTDDLEDRRSKRLSINPLGQNIAYSMMERMTDVSKIVAGNLTTVEKQELLRLLQKLEDFHVEKLEKVRGMDWEEMSIL